MPPASSVPNAVTRKAAELSDVERDAVAALEPALLELAREAQRAVEQLAVGELAGVVGDGVAVASTSGRARAALSWSRR